MPALPAGVSVPGELRVVLAHEVRQFVFAQEPGVALSRGCRAAACSRCSACWCPVLSKPLMVGATGRRLRNVDSKDSWNSPRQIDHRRDGQVVVRRIGAVGGEVVVQVLRDVQHALAALQRVRHRELIPVREALVEPDQQRLVLRRRARPPEVDRARRALRGRIVRLRRRRAARNDRAADRIELVVVDAGAEEAARRLIAGPSGRRSRPAATCRCSAGAARRR